MKRCALCKKRIWPWQDWLYIKSPERPYHWDCGYKLDDNEQPRTKESFATEAYYREMLKHSDYRCVKCGFTINGYIPTKHKTVEGKKCDGSFMVIKTLEV